MAKIKVVQVAIAMSDENGADISYLDDKGRVWYDVGHLEKYDQDEVKKSYKSRWITEWKQVDLPDEPS